jgi:hypothetical protein
MRLIRDFWGKRTEKKAMDPGVRTILESLDGVYEPKRPAPGPTPDPSADRAQQESP